MKIIICTTPIRPVPTDYPPFGSLAVIQSLRGAGYNPLFYDIDVFRPSFEDVIEYFKKESPDVIGISAVVSTAYGYVKKLVPALKKILPNSHIIVGGNLSASAELLHRFCNVDICAIGEGEKIIVNLANYFKQNLTQTNYDELKKIKGITYLDPNGDLIFTGYELAIPAEEMFEPDFSILEEFSNIDNFVNDHKIRIDFVQDPRSSEPHRDGKKMTIAIFTKGCVARCTFCHRWDKGFRQTPAEKMIKKIRYLMDRYNVGFIQFGDENFGSDKKATEELIQLIKPLDILWGVAGVRARSLDISMLQRMKDAGCAAVYYGFESGSPDILKIMEKNMTVEHNLKAARATYDAGLFTIYQLVLGMPGESPRTILETIEMIKSITEFLPETPNKFLSINYIQALPGTPIYEYARAKGFIGPTLKDEDEYMLTISNTDAYDDAKFINFTSYPYLIVRSWRKKILYEAIVHWWRVRKRFSDVRSSSTSEMYREHYKKHYHSRKSGYFNLHHSAYYTHILTAFYPLRWLIIWMYTFWSEFKTSPKKVFFRRVWELISWNLRGNEEFNDYRSVRQIMKDIAAKPTGQTQESMTALRLGR